MRLYRRRMLLANSGAFPPRSSSNVDLALRKEGQTPARYCDFSSSSKK
jgi:hypothetical protein